ncbi:MAG TPA: glycosyltransferase family 4 protein [Steroidobacteraceae bacterium]
MRILYHHRTQGEEPESVHIAAVVAALRRLGHEVDIVGPAPIGVAGESPRASAGAGGGRSLLGRLKEAAPRFLVELAQLGFNVVSVVQLARALARQRYDFIYERYALYNVAGLMAARAFGIPLVLEVNTLYAQAWRKYYGLRLARLARLTERLAVRRAHAVITVTDVQRVLLEEEGVRPERITVSPNAIDPAEFDPGRWDGGLRQRLGLPTLVAGFVGTMNRWQGVQGFAEVIEQVAKVRPDVGFLFVGDGEGRAGLEAELERRGARASAVFVGRQPHAAVPEFLAAMDIGLLLDSNSYGSPMKVFEYWAMGKAVIAPRVAPVLEVMRDGETGLLIAPGDAPAMAQHILTLAADARLRAKLAEAGRRRVLASHTWERNAAKILEALAAHPSPRPARSKEGHC